MSELPIKGTFKAGAGYEAPWITVDASDPDDLAVKLRSLIGHDDAVQAVIEFSNVLRGGYTAAPVLPGNQGQAAAPAPAPAPAQQPAPSGWGSPAGAQHTQAAPLVVLHPEGVTCGSCNAPVQYKSIFSKAKNKTFNLWSCPNQRSKGDGHYSEFAD